MYIYICMIYTVVYLVGYVYHVYIYIYIHLHTHTYIYIYIYYTWPTKYTTIYVAFEGQN